MNTKRIFYIISFFFLLSCTNVRKQNMADEKSSCLPGYIWITYVGESTRITRFTLIRTSSSDTSYLSTYQERWKGLADDGLFKIYCNNYIADINLFSQLKKYVISNHTHKEYNLFNINNYSAINIIIVDKCDSIGYIVNESDPDYFSKMVDSLKITDDKLKEYLLYYHGIQKCGDNDI